MSLIDLDRRGRDKVVNALEHEAEFNLWWDRISPEEQEAIEDEINRRLDVLRRSPHRRWGSITNTSIEGGRVNPFNGIPGDWAGTVFDPIYEACGGSKQQAALVFGSIWKKVIIKRSDRWIGYRPDPTFPQRGITLPGKSYFPDLTG